jgi:predicted amidohydrolase YtcJ
MTSSTDPFEHLTVYTARRIRTMTDALPAAEAMAVANGRIVSVGTLESLKPWLDAFPHSIDDRFAGDVLLPGLIDPHVHPSLPAVTTQFPILAPDDWTLPSGVYPGATTPDAYIARLKELYSQHSDWSVPFIVWGFHPLWHGDQYRPQLDVLFPDRPVVLWHRSFHELILNTPALEWFGLREEEVRGRLECDWERGHFWENGAQPLVVKLGPVIFDPERYGNGTLHSDCPMAPLSPLTLAWAATNRVTINGNLRCPEEKVRLHAALRAITIDAAWILRMENEIGSIRAGKRADFAVLADDPYDVGAEGLRHIAVKGVVFEGEPHPL